QPQAADAARTPAENVGGLEPGELPTQRSQDDLLHFHRALHGADGVGHGHLLGDLFSPGACLERSFHVALASGQITYSRQAARYLLTGPAAAANDRGAIRKSRWTARERPWVMCRPA